MYKDIYSALYEFTFKRWQGDDYMASWMTAVGLSGALGMNLALVVAVLVASYGPLPPAFKWVPAVVLISLFLLNYNAFIRRDRYVSVVQRFRDYPSTTRRRVTVVAWFYVVVSYVAPICFALLMFERAPR